MANSQQNRCVNLDWLEVYCLEGADGFPHDASYFRDQGLDVLERDYGTRQYHEMFTILDRNGQGFVEIRRNPVSGGDSRNKGIFSPYSCHVRLCNRYCYHENAVNLLTEFLHTHHFEVQRIFRIDIALDFERFDSGDDPVDFIRRYMAGRYAKINQCNLSAHGADRWNVRDWNSLSWGSPSSMVGTKLYCKTKELKEVKDKPYIRYAWQAAGLVSDYVNMTKAKADGTCYQPTIWRLEFSIKSSARVWYKVEDTHGRKTRKIEKQHTLGNYSTRHDLLQAFIFLAYHYFQFKHFEEGKRKDRCRDKVLFDFGSNHSVYVLDRLLTDEPQTTALEALRQRLLKYKQTHIQPKLIRACDVLIEQIAQERIVNTLPYYDGTEVRLLQLLIKQRLECPDESYSQSLSTVKDFMQLSDTLF